MVRTVVKLPKKGDSHHLSKPGSYSESLDFKVFYVLLVLQSWHQDDSLHMRGVRKHVDGLRVGDGITAGDEVRRATRQGGEVARDVDDAARLPVGGG